MTVCRGDLSRLDSLLKDTSINVVDKRERSLLHWALGCDRDTVVNHLIDLGIETDLVDSRGNTPIHLAVQRDNYVSFVRLCEAQRDDDWVQQYGPALLGVAVLNRNAEIIAKLVSLGVDVNSENDRGSTPVQIARRIKAIEVTELLVMLGADTSISQKIIRRGKYMGQPPPGKTPRMFAPHFISTEESEFGSVFNKAGNEFYFAVDVKGKSEIRYTKMIDSLWSDPKVLLSHDRYGYNDPFLSVDEKKLYFISSRSHSVGGAPKDIDIWYVERRKDGWSDPRHLRSNINSQRNEYYISFTDAGTMYFSSNISASDERKQTDYDIYFATADEGGGFHTPMALGPEINTPGYEADVFISPDESYMIFCSEREEGFGQGDLYISFKMDDYNWSTAINMGEQINSQNYEYCPFVTRDRKFLFYTSNQDIYWIGTNVIDKLREKVME